MKIKQAIPAVVFALLLVISGSHYALAKTDIASLQGSWRLQGDSYAYVYIFSPSGTVEKIMYMDESMVWAGSGTYRLSNDTISITLDQTASNTRHKEQYKILLIKKNHLRLKQMADYFSDIATPELTLTRVLK